MMLNDMEKYSIIKIIINSKLIIIKTLFIYKKNVNNAKLSSFEIKTKKQKQKQTHKQKEKVHTKFIVLIEIYITFNLLLVLFAICLFILLLIFLQMSSGKKDSLVTVAGLSTFTHTVVRRATGSKYTQKFPFLFQLKINQKISLRCLPLLFHHNCHLIAPNLSRIRFIEQFD